MIWESGPWKQELLEHANIIEKCIRSYSPKISERKHNRLQFKLERAIFYSVFIVRKLIENDKLTNTCSYQKIKVQRFKSKRTEASLRKSLGVEIGRDFEAFPEGEKEISIVDLLNQFIHSILLAWEINDEDVLIGMFVCSELGERKEAIQLSFAKFCEVIRSVGNDYVVLSVRFKAPETGKIISKRFSTLPEKF